MILAYICHPFASDPAANVPAVTEVCREIMARNLRVRALDDVSAGRGKLPEVIVPVAPHLLFPAMLGDDERPLVMAACLALVEKCDALFVVGDTLSPGMREEMAAAQAARRPVRFYEDWRAKWDRMMAAAAAQAR